MSALTELQARLEALPANASPARRWQVVRVETKRLMRAYGMPSAVVSPWSVFPLPSQARTRYGDCTYSSKTIRYRSDLVEHEAEIRALAATIVHEVAHAITEYERLSRSPRPKGGHGPMWRGLTAAMGLRDARAMNLPALAGGRK